jgi:beta-lactamase regulating signal transducer with metallopeptidase domain
MMSAELTSLDWSGRGLLLVLAFTAGVACVALLRHGLRRLFGAECAMTLWLLPPLAMVASQLPHVAGQTSPVAGSLLLVLSDGGGWSPAADAAAPDWRAVAALLWLVGVAVRLALAAHAQARYRACLQDAVPLAGMTTEWPVWRAASPTIGPALVGAWNPRIVVPVDFEQRYAARERTLILAHEATHARRRDGWWCLLAQVCAALYWFHPLAWWALGALRRDQELACDAAVLRACGGSRRSYAQAMLKTPAARHALPVGCSWSSRHPLTERIAMLKASQPSSRRRLAGLLTGLAFATGLTGTVYAASAPAGAPVQSAASGDPEYQLDMEVSLLGDGAKASEARRLNVALCMKAGEPASMSTHGILLDARTQPMGDHHLRVDLSVRGSPDATPARAKLQGAVGEPLLASGRLEGGGSHYLVQVTPREGCPARASTDAAAQAPVTMKLSQGTVRGAAELIAHQAGLSLANPQALGSGPAAMEFRDVPADRAMQWVAGLAGLHAVFEGRQVRFQAE